MPTKEESEAAAALTEFWTGVKRDQPEIEWHLESTKMMVALSPVEYEGKQYTPGELFYPASGRILLKKPEPSLSPTIWSNL
jgi:hypothetical protein